MVAFHLFTGANPYSDLVGIAAGHLYFYLKHVLPDSHGHDLLKTPNFIKTLTRKLKNWGADAQ